MEWRQERVVVETRLAPLDGSGPEWTARVPMLARRHIRLIVATSEGA